jgi:hypothetical protein
VCLGWGGSDAYERVARWASAIELAAPLALGLLAIAMHWTGVVAPTLAMGSVAAAVEHEEQGALAAREMAEWLRAHSPESGDYCVLANWGSGHLIEWGADRPSSATNFGSYVGLDGFQAPSRFFLEEDPARAEEILASRRARYVFVLSSMPGIVAEMAATACPERASRYLEGGAGGRELREPFFDTLGAHLLLGGVRLHRTARSELGLPSPRLRESHREHGRAARARGHEASVRIRVGARGGRASGSAWGSRRRAARRVARELP